ncbi:unnamed protein product [Cuscuta campestris]|uniref:F-box domain-containing protein n=2 Tax=Cuscuta sect. Cleistogrammica TaxID=1824901 RepID=A0A484KI76_9ASTE|nr:hypothetical protein DM860_009406 [Cuscuta australis]VFQ61782.1 unnamed protein product [Cuscuta campestris]
MSERHHLPEEILIEILTRLPVRSLARFTAVSKSWFFFITSPAFASAHLRHSRCRGNSAGNLLFHRRFEISSKKEKYEILEESDHQTLTPISSPQICPPIACKVGYFRVVGCYNGVVCLSDDLYSDSYAMYLWNPWIQKFKTLPPPTIRPAWPFTSTLGFGVNPQCVDDLKVVRAVFGRNGECQGIPDVPPDVEIYSLRTGKWRRISAVGVNLYMINFIWSQTFAHGAVHWIGYKSLDNEMFKCSIAVFTLDNEVFSEIMLSDELASGVVGSSLNIMTFGESIVVAKYGEAIHGAYCELWMMKEYGVVESWCRLRRIELVEGMRRIVGFRENSDILFSTNEGELVSYCPDTEVINKLGIYGSIRSLYVGKYLESLVLLQEQSCVIDGLSEEMTSMSI